MVSWRGKQRKYGYVDNCFRWLACLYLKELLVPQVAGQLLAMDSYQTFVGVNLELSLGQLVSRLVITVIS